MCVDDLNASLFPFNYILHMSQTPINTILHSDFTPKSHESTSSNIARKLSFQYQWDYQNDNLFPFIYILHMSQTSINHQTALRFHTWISMISIVWVWWLMMIKRLIFFQNRERPILISKASTFISSLVYQMQRSDFCHATIRIQSHSSPRSSF